MKLKTLVAASVLALASAGAQAASTLAGPTTTINQAGSAGTYVNSSFTHNWNLNINEGPTYGGAQVDIQFADVPGTLDLGYVQISFDIGGMTVTNDLTFTGTASNNIWNFSGWLANSNNPYAITVSGDIASGANAGLYNTTFSAVPAAAPVPIPPAALLFGSALIGLAGLKRKKAAKELVEA